jgi:hypothetical protein
MFPPVRSVKGQPQAQITWEIKSTIWGMPRSTEELCQPRPGEYEELGCYWPEC